MTAASIESPEPQLYEVLQALYEEQLRLRDDPYLRTHAQTKVAQSQAAVFEFYAPHLPPNGIVLDWGCRHAPDACLMRARFGTELRIDGCDVVEPGAYPVFHGYAGLHYQTLDDPVRLPYADASFDAVVASGTLEHVAMDYESLKKLYRVLRADGCLIVTYLPIQLSAEEWYKKTIRREGFHRRLYRLGDAVQLLKHAGFYPRVAGYQTHLDLLPARSLRHRVLRKLR